MSKITREEAIKIIKSNWPDKRYSMLIEALNYFVDQQPQLSDDVEEFFDDIYELAIQVDYEYEDGKDYSDKMKVKLAIIKQHIQAQASEIEGQKAITKEVSDTAMETIHEMNNKLNAIREVVKNTDILWKLDNEYLEQLREIKQILKENNNEEHIK